MANPLNPRCPAIPKELLDYLHSTFPVSRPRLTDSEREIFFKVGQHSVVEFLQAKYNEQTEDVLRA